MQLASAMVSIFAADKTIKTILEPSCGDGVFIDAAIEAGLINNVELFRAIEIEAGEVKTLKNRIAKYKNIDVRQKDFFDYYNEAYKTTKYDLILGNPPYIRYQYLTETQREIQSKILISHGMKSNKLINAWVGFLVACVQMLNENGKIAFVIPAEILQVAYAEDLRLYLSNHFSKITLITFEKLVFPDIEQEVLVFIGEKGHEEKGIRIFEMSDLDNFSSINLEANGYREMQHVKEKWTKYFTSSEETKLIQKIKRDNRFQKFSDCGIINIGITTGNNDYFSIDNETAKKYDLSQVLIPLIGRSSHAHGIYFTKEDWLKNVNNGKRAQLIKFPDVSYENYPIKHKEYIEKGEREGQNKGYKCSIRDRWYIVPAIWVPDAFFLRRNNLYPKFVLNNCEAVSTDTMHRIKFNDDIDHETILLSYYNSISFAFTEICGRSYGGGVLEILPGEMGNIILPKINGIDAQLKKGLLHKIDNIVRNNDDIEGALNVVDEEVLIGLLGIDPKVCKQFRAIWKKLQKRRLGRG
ncbi:MAG: Modification methylase Eco57IB [Firmicutes bacterium ADurb.Bin193]|nr:MAG: Modification methylase Eco57IB [Firmicutes bacterium ADurb.Bin193]